MGLHSPIERHFITNEGAVKTTGGSLKLTKGQFAIVDLDAPNTRQGKPLVNSFQGKSPTNQFELALGVANIGATRSLSNKSYNTIPFTLNDVEAVRVSAPNGKEDQVDDLVIGFNGVDGTEIDMNNGDTEIVQVTLTGKGIEYLGYEGGKAVVQITLIAPDKGTKITTGTPTPGTDEWTMQGVIEDGIKRLLGSELLGQTAITEVVDVLTVNSTNPATIPGVDQVFYSLTLMDDGTYSSLAKVQAQYPDLNIKKESVSTMQTKYVAVGTTSPADYTTSLPDLIKGCNTCPTGYTEISDGFVYSVELQDNETDNSAAVQSLPGAEIGSAVRNGGEAGTGSGFYSVVTDDALTQAEIDAFVVANPTAVVTQVSSDVSELCTNPTTVAASWVTGDTCKVSTETYTIRLGDDECGNTILPKLQETYPDLVITELATPAPAGCSRSYSTTIETNLVCEECSPIYRELFDSEAPHKFDQIAWKKEDKIYDGAAKMGIRVRGKKIRMGGSENFRDEIPFIADSTRVELVGGFQTDINENYKIGEKGRFNVTLLSRYTPPTHLGGQLYMYEDMSNTYFGSTRRHEGDNYAKFVNGEESLIKPFAQYVDYAITIYKRRYAQGVGRKQEEGLTFHIFAEVGRHQDVENLVNSLASASGIPTVQAFAKA